MWRLFRKTRTYKLPDYLFHIQEEPALPVRAGPLPKGHQPASNPNAIAPQRGRRGADKRMFRAFLHRICPCITSKATDDADENDAPFTRIGQSKILESTSQAKGTPVTPSSSVQQLRTSASIQDKRTIDPSTPSDVDIMCAEVSSPSSSYISAEVSPPPSSRTPDQEPSPPLTKSSQAHGLTVESFSFHEILGQGAFGKVVLASHPACDKKLAVKILQKKKLLEQDPTDALRERIILKACGRCPYISHLLCSFQTQTHLFFVMEYLSGGELRELINSSAPLGGKVLRNLTAEILCGLQYLHSKEIVHRDLKPENILLDGAGHPKIADFGLSETGISEENRIAGRTGTQTYMAPEVFLGFEYFIAADYFSLGVIVYEMKLGFHPFYTGKEDMDELRWIMGKVTPYYPLDMDTILQDLLKRLLHKGQNIRMDLVRHIRQHAYFHGIDWAKTETGNSPPPLNWEPILQAPEDELLELSEVVKPEDLQASIRPQFQNYFHGFSYISDRMNIQQVASCSASESPSNHTYDKFTPASSESPLAAWTSCTEFGVLPSAEEHNDPPKVTPQPSAGEREVSLLQPAQDINDPPTEVNQLYSDHDINAPPIELNVQHTTDDNTPRPIEVSLRNKDASLPSTPREVSAVPSSSPCDPELHYSSPALSSSAPDIDTPPPPNVDVKNKPRAWTLEAFTFRPQRRWCWPFFYLLARRSPPPEKTESGEDS